MQRGFVRKRGQTWTAYYYLTTGSGRRQCSRGGFRTKALALGYLNDTMAALQRDEVVEPTRVSVGEYLLDRWLPLMANTIRPSTWQSYKHMVATHVIPTLGHLQLQRLTADHLDQLYAGLLVHGRVDG